jgi:hypothetical protein
MNYGFEKKLHGYQNVQQPVEVDFRLFSVAV